LAKNSGDDREIPSASEDGVERPNSKTALADDETAEETTGGTSKAAMHLS